VSVLPILLWPDARLSQKCAPVEDGRVDDLVADMFDTMYAARGTGLAASQVGKMVRIFVMDCGWKSGASTPLAMINPTIMAAERVPVTVDENCLSIPGTLVPVERHKAVTVQWSAPQGDIHMADFDGDESLCIQHEIDHLNGIVTFGRIDADLRRQVEAAYLTGDCP